MAGVTKKVITRFALICSAATASFVAIAQENPLSKIKVIGTAQYGGEQNQGLIFETDVNLDNFKNVEDFVADPDGNSPSRNNVMLLASDGNLYGATTDPGNGLLFRFNPNTYEYAVVHRFTTQTGSVPTGHLIEGAPGKIYGINRKGGETDHGVLWQYDMATGVCLRKRSLTGEYVVPSFIAKDNILYILQGNDASMGGLFSYNMITEEWKVLVNGRPYWVSGIAYLNNKLYWSEPSNTERIVEFDLANSSLTYVASYSNIGLFAYGGITLAQNGNMYIPYASGSTGGGTIVEFNPVTKAVTKKVDINTLPGNPSSLRAAFTPKPDGKLYGVVQSGGTGKSGLIFEYVPGETTATVIHQLDKTLTGGISGALTLLPDGRLFGLGSGGAYGAGTIIEYNRNTSEFFVRKNFIHAPDGANPTGKSIIVGNTLIGMAGGGTKNSGIMFKYDIEKKEYQKLFDVADKTSWGSPFFAKADNGKVYSWSGFGVTGSPTGKFVFHEYNPTTSEFTNILETESSTQGFVFDFKPGINGKMYGTTGNGGTNNAGYIFEFDANTRTTSVVHNFSAFLNHGVIAVEADKAIYGYGVDNTTYGSVYRLDLETKNYKVLFTADTLQAEHPRGFWGGPILHEGKLYGTIWPYLPPELGYVWEYDIAKKKFRKLYDLKNYPPSPPDYMLSLSPEGKIWVLENGFNNGLSTYAEIDPKTGITTSKLAFEGPTGLYASRLMYVKVPQDISLRDVPLKSTEDAAFKLDATVDSGLPLTFSSSNTAVAIVNGDLVTIVGAGETTIIARQPGNLVYDYAEVSKQLKIIAKQEQTITFNTIATKTIGGAPFSTGATSSSGLALTYIATPADRVTITNSTVTMLKEGRVTIKASQAGSFEFKPAADVQQSFCINPQKPTVTSAGGPTQAVFTSGNDTGNQWYKNGTAIPGATSKTFTASEDGSYTVQTKTDDCLSETSEAIVFTKVGVEDLENAISVYPNPVRDELIIDAGTTGSVYVTLSDVVGRTVQSFEATGTRAIDMRHLQRGMYVLTIKTGEIATTRKILKTE